MRIETTAAWLSLCILLSACGWHLQGGREVAVRVSPVYLDADDMHSEFARALLSRLEQARVAVAPSRDAARVSIRVSSESSGHHVSAVSALNEPQQYEVYYGITWGISAGPEAGVDNATVPEQNSTVARTMNYDKTAAMAMLRQEQAVQRRLAEELADQVMRRLATINIAGP